jgi:Ca2+-binding RTX toxin-like protein
VSLLLTTAQNTGGAGTDTLTSIENLTGSAFNDALTGNGANNLLSGGAGHDSLSGGTGNDSLLGGAGLDRLDGGTGNDSLDGGADADTASYAAATAAVSVSLLLATAQNTGGAGTDTLTAIENLTGSAYNDRLTGNTAANVLQGGTGNDTLLGGSGLDSLSGGAGADVFDFNALTDSGSTATSCDLISDFNAAQGDHIDLRDIDLSPTQTGVQHFTGFIALNVAFSAPGQLHFDAATGLLTANTDTDAAAEFALKLTGVTSLAAGSLWLA